jgi:hypothetical protein
MMEMDQKLGSTLVSPFVPSFAPFCNFHLPYVPFLYCFYTLSISLRPNNHGLLTFRAKIFYVKFCTATVGPQTVPDPRLGTLSKTDELPLY